MASNERKNKNLSTISDKLRNNLHLGNLSAGKGNVTGAFLKWARFLTFREKEPKHRTMERLSPIHALLVFDFCFILPAVIFFLTINMGLIQMLATELSTIWLTLEIMHILYDR